MAELKELDYTPTGKLKEGDYVMVGGGMVKERVYRSDNKRCREFKDISRNN